VVERVLQSTDLPLAALDLLVQVVTLTLHRGRKKEAQVRRMEASRRATES
jgi:hypothetical protein